MPIIIILFRMIIEMLGVSVIIPLFNREKYIGEAIQSVLDQHFFGTLEIIVSDDGSTDAGVDIALSFGPPVKVILKPESCTDQGVSGARNRGILVASQSYIAFLDSDDYYLPDHLNKMVALLEHNRMIGFAFSRMVKLQEIGGVRQFTPWTRENVNARDIAYPVLTRTNIVSTNIFLFRSEIFTNVDLFNTIYSNGEDGDMWMRISELYKGIFSNHFGAVYRLEHSSDQLTSKNTDTIKQFNLKILTSALERYQSRGLRDEYREFLLKQNLVGIRFSGEFRLRYFIELLKLMANYPRAFALKFYDYLRG